MKPHATLAGYGLRADTHRHAILGYLLEMGPSTTDALASASGLSRARVGDALRGLPVHGWPVPRPPGQVGRLPRVWSLAAPLDECRRVLADLDAMLAPA